LYISETIDVAIGLVFLFLLVSLICSSIREGLEGILKYRARDLLRGIQEILGTESTGGLVADIYRHPLISALYRGPYNPLKGGNLPTYIPATTFSLALIDVVRSMAPLPPDDPGSPVQPITNPFLELRSTVQKIDNQSIKKALLPLIDAANGDIVKARENIEEWYNSAMDRVSGWYKQETQQILVALGLALALLMNIDAIGIARYLSTNQTARAALISQLQKQRSPANPSDSELANPEAWLERQGGLPVGWLFTPQSGQTAEDFQRDWRRAPVSVGGWVMKLGGILLTTFAVSLGAPFWFDILNRFMVVRSTVKPREKSKDEKSKD
jgi:hypothetical protein